MDSKVSCDYCDQKFSSIMKLQSHHKKAHKTTLLEKIDTNIDKPSDKKSYESAKPYLEAHCTHCANSYTSQSELRNHIKLIHEFDTKTSARLSEFYSSYITWENKEATINVFCNLCKSKLAAVSNIRNWQPISHWQHCSKQFSEQNVACEEIGNIAENNIGKNVEPNIEPPKCKKRGQTDQKLDKNVTKGKSTRSKDPINNANMELNELLEAPQKRNRKAPARYSEFVELTFVGALIEEKESKDANLDEKEPKTSVPEQNVAKTRKATEVIELMKTDQKATKSAKFATTSIDDDQDLAKNAKSAKSVLHSSNPKSEKAFPCTYPNCEKGYSQASNLKVHEKTHKGEKSFGCKIDFDEDINVVEDFTDATLSCEQASNSSNSKENKKTLEEIMYPDLPEVEFEPIQPKMSYSELIAEALQNSPNGYLTFSELCISIAEKYPYFKIGQSSWQNFVRGKLRHDKSFAKTWEAQGSPWTLSKNPQKPSKSKDANLDEKEPKTLVPEQNVAKTRKASEALELMKTAQKATKPWTLSKNPPKPPDNFVKASHSSDSNKNKKTLEEIMYPDLPDVEFEPNEPIMSYSELIAEALQNSPNGTLTFSEICISISAKYPYYKIRQKSWKNFVQGKLTHDKKFAKTSFIFQKGWSWTLSKNPPKPPNTVDKASDSSDSKENKKQLGEIMYPDLLEYASADLLVDKNIEENFDQDIEDITVVEDFKIEAEDVLISSEGANVLVEKDFEEYVQENCHPNEETSDEDIKVVGSSLGKLSKVEVEEFKVEPMNHEQASSSLQSKENKTLDEKIDTFDDRAEKNATKVNFVTWVKEMNFDKSVNKILHENVTKDNEVIWVLPRDSLTKEVNNVISFSDNTNSNKMTISKDTEDYSEAHCTHCEVRYTRSLATLKTLQEGNFSGAVFTRGHVKDDLTNHIKNKHGFDLNKLNSVSK